MKDWFKNYEDENGQFPWVSAMGPVGTGGFSGKGPKGWKYSDDKIRDEVCEALYVNQLVDASDIEVHVDSGRVQLKGWVHDRMSKREAEECIENLNGVTDVQNQLRINCINETKELHD